jgi:hypothetical protein
MLEPAFAAPSCTMSNLKAAIAIPALIAFSKLVKFYRKMRRRYVG